MMQSDSWDGDNEQRTYTYSPALEKLQADDYHKKFKIHIKCD